MNEVADELHLATGTQQKVTFAIAFVTNILEGISPTEFEFSVTSMPKHLLECLEKQQLSTFPQNPKRARRVVSSEGFRIFKI